MKEILLNIGDDTILVQIDANSGTVRSSLKDSDPDALEYNAAIDALESIVLGHACAGVNIEDPKYVEGLQTALEAFANNL